MVLCYACDLMSHGRQPSLWCFKRRYIGAFSQSRCVHDSVVCSHSPKLLRDCGCFKSASGSGILYGYTMVVGIDGTQSSVHCTCNEASQTWISGTLASHYAVTTLCINHSCVQVCGWIAVQEHWGIVRCIRTAVTFKQTIGWRAVL